MNKLTQDRAPVYEALKNVANNRIVHFDVPGHKGGRGNTLLTGFLGEECMRLDVNSMKPLDNLCHPTSVIREAEELCAEAFGAHDCFFMVGGTTSSVQAMIMTVCKAGDTIIMPRNVHRSAINALVICGATPCYVNPGTDARLGIPLGMSVDEVRAAMDAHPEAKAVLVNNPTYYGICSNLDAIVKLAHERGMYVLADEAHGTHFYFGDGLPTPAMRAGADMSAISIHKTGGSLTQSSVLLLSQRVNAAYARQVVNLTQTTSASYLLLSSLDIARKHLYRAGKEMFSRTVELARYARESINRIGGYYAYAGEMINGDTVYSFDTTKLSVYTGDIGLAGIEVYDLLRDEYDIQIELGDLSNILAIITAGDRAFEIERLISALSEIKRIYAKDRAGMISFEYINPIVKLPPQTAFYSERKPLPVEKTLGYVCGEFVMCYPPGIPILAPGELITQEIIDYILYAKEKGCLITGPQDMNIDELMVI